MATGAVAVDASLSASQQLSSGSPQTVSVNANPIFNFAPTPSPVAATGELVKNLLPVLVIGGLLLLLLSAKG